MTSGKKYWEGRYEYNQTGWDLGAISPPLKEYIDQLENKNLRILIPGAGNSYEAEYLFQLGFKNVIVLDLAPYPLQSFRRRVPDFPACNIQEKDFFKLEGSFDLILEQTFFCALPPGKREDYVTKAFKLLKPGGRIAGVLFASEFKKEGPPFGGSKKEYLDLFSRLFQIQVLEACYNSIPPRMDNELFFIFKKN